MTSGIAQVRDDYAAYQKSVVHLQRAQKRHYNVVGLRNFYRKHYLLQRNLHHIRGVNGTVNRMLGFYKHMRRAQWKIKRWGTIRVRLHKRVRERKLTWLAEKAHVQQLIAEQAAAQSRQANQILAQIEAASRSAAQKSTVGWAKNKDGKDTKAAKQVVHREPSILSGHSPGVVAVRAALTQLGVPYVWGGATPGKAFDCSGLTQWAWGQAGVSLVHFAATQAHEGTPVSIKNLQPGDLLFFESPIGHVTMYVGDGIMIEAPHTGDVVHLTRLDDSWYVSNFQGAVRPG